MILALGDSFTFGLELPDCPAVWNSYEFPPSKFAWPTLLATRLGQQVVNLSMPGGSNDRIFRLAMAESVAKKYDIIICAWTSLTRIDIKYNGKDFPVTLNSGKWYSDKLPWINDFYKFSYDEHHFAESWLAKLVALQDYFKYNNQKYLFLNMQSSGIFPGFLGTTAIIKFVEFESLIDRNFYIGWPNEGMVEWQGDCAKGPGGHPLELGHKRIADKIYEHIRTLGWI